MSVAALAFALPLIKHSFSMSPLMIGAVSAASVVGMAVGTMTGGRASDHIGRRRLFLISMAAITVGALGSAVAGSPELILISQFILGCGIGSEFPNSTTFGMPALLFPSEIGVSAAGFSTACAKIGATLGTLFLPTISKAIGL
jgi:MFS family permease